MSDDRHLAELRRRELRDTDGSPLPDSLLDPGFDQDLPAQTHPVRSRRERQPRTDTIDPVIANILADLTLVTQALWSRAHLSDIPDEVILWVILRYCVGVEDPRGYAGRRRKRMAQKGFIQRAKSRPHTKEARWLLLPRGKQKHPQKENPRIPEAQRTVPRLTWGQAVFAATQYRKGEKLLADPPKRLAEFTARILQDLLVAQGTVGRGLTHEESLRVLMRYPRFAERLKAVRYRGRLQREYTLLERDDTGDTTLFRAKEPLTWETVADRRGNTDWKTVPTLTRDEALRILPRRSPEESVQRRISAFIRTLEREDLSERERRLLRSLIKLLQEDNS